MSTIHIEIRNDIMFDIFDQKIYFHKNQNKIKEYLIPDGYEIKYWDEKFIHIASKKIVPPTEIPLGYDSLQYTCYGLYEVTSKSEDTLVNGLSTPNRIKSLYYIDTNLIKEEKFKKLANSFSIQEAVIPDSFWYFPAKVAENQYVRLSYFAMDENHENFAYEKLDLDSTQDECLLPIPIIYQKI